MRLLILLFLVFGGLYALLLSFLYFYQARLVYFPANRLWATPERVNLDFEEVVLEAGGETIYGWYIPSDSGAPVVLICHGNAGNIADRLEMIERMYQAGLSTLIFDYHGYGRSTGQPGEQATYADAEAAYQWLMERGYREQEIILFGKSLGAAVAGYLAQNRPVRALVLESSFSSLADVAAVHYPWVPVRMLLRFTYPTVDYVKQVRAPVVVIHSRDDEIVPLELGQRVFAAAHEPKRFIEVTGGHNMYPETPWSEIMAVEAAPVEDDGPE